VGNPTSQYSNRLTSNRPTRVKVNIRDIWSKDDSDVQKAITEVRKLIGHDVVIEPEWQLLWAELQKHYSDNSRFVPDIAKVVIAWCRSLCEIADDDRNEQWTETLLERLKAAHILKVLFDVRISTMFDVRSSVSHI
jgi:hypothetical protein